MNAASPELDDQVDDQVRSSLPLDAEAGLPGMRFDVVLENGERYRVRATNADMVAFDLMASKKKWPDGQKAPFLWATFLAWRSSKRTGKTSLTFEAFQDAAAEVEAVTGETDVVPPSRPTPEHGSASGSLS